MEENFKNELVELKNLQESGTELDEAQTSRLTLLNELDKAEQTAEKKQKDLDSALAQKEHFRTKAEEAKVVQQPNINMADILALKDVNPEDIKEVEDYAKFKGISLAEAMKSSVIKTTLAEKEEQRKTAAATQIRTARQTQAQTQTDDEIEGKARNDVNNLPDPEKLAEARNNIRLKKK